MKNWEQRTKNCRSHLRGYCAKFWGNDAYDLLDDAISFAICENWGMDEFGLDEEMVHRMLVRSASRFVSRELRWRGRTTPMTQTNKVNGNEFSILDIYPSPLTHTKAMQEINTDANMVLGVIGDGEMAEVIAYGDNREGGLARVRAERVARESIGTYRKKSAS